MELGLEPQSVFACPLAGTHVVCLHTTLHLCLFLFFISQQRGGSSLIHVSFPPLRLSPRITCPSPPLCCPLRPAWAWLSNPFLVIGPEQAHRSLLPSHPHLHLSFFRLQASLGLLGKCSVCYFLRTPMGLLCRGPLPILVLPGGGRAG